jgi:hypothetical protein
VLATKSLIAAVHDRAPAPGGRDSAPRSSTAFNAPILETGTQSYRLRTSKTNRPLFKIDIALYLR